ncbi:MAG TPA: KGG domain-containing protein [Rudaea sp.]
MDHVQQQQDKPVQKRLRGFAAMPADRQRAIASAGGRAAHESGNAHEFDSNAAREAGRKGGYKVSENREHMAAIGRKGGRIGGGRRNRNAANAEGSGSSAMIANENVQSAA